MVMGPGFPGMGAVGGGGGAMGTIWAEMGLNVQKLRSGFQSAKSEIRTQERTIQQRMDRLGSSMTRAGQRMSMALTAPLVGLGALVTRTTMQFEDQMARVQAISGATGEGFEELQEQAREMGRTTSFSATEAAQGMEMLARAGWDTHSVMVGIEPVLRMAEAAQLDLGRASDITSDIMTAFRIEAEQVGSVTDVLAATATSANTTVEMLGQTMAYAAPAAHAAGLGIEEVAAMSGALADAGIKGSRAGTTLNAMLTDMSNLSEQAAEQMEEQGVAIYDVNGNMRSMVDIIADIEDATRDMTSQQRDNFLQLGFNSRSLRGLNVLLAEGADSLRDYTTELENSEGAVETMGETMRDTLAYELKELRSEVDGILLDLGEGLVPVIRQQAIPAARWLSREISNITSWFADLDPWLQGAIVSFAGFTAATGPAVWVLGSLVTNAKALLPVLKLLGGGLALLKAPAVAAVLALGLTAGGLAWVIRRLRGEASETADGISELDQEIERLGQREETLSPLIDRYRELKEQGELNTQELRDFWELHQQLKAAMPGLAEEWDAMHGVLTLSVGEMENYVGSLSRAREQAQGVREELEAARVVELQRELRQIRSDLGDIGKGGTFLAEEMDRIGQVAEVLDTNLLTVNMVMRALVDEMGMAEAEAEQYSHRLLEALRTVEGMEELTRDQFFHYETINMAIGQLSQQTVELRERKEEILGILQESTEELELHEKSIEQLKELSTEVAEQHETAHNHMRAMSVVLELVRDEMRRYGRETADVSNVVDRMVRRSEQGRGVLADYPAEYEVMLELLTSLTGLKEDQLVTEEEIEEAMHRYGSEAGDALILLQEINSLIESRQEAEEEVTEEISEQQALLEAIRGLEGERAEQLRRLGIRAAGYGRDLDVPIEKMGILGDSVRELLDEGLTPTDQRISDLVARAMALSDQTDDTSAALQALYRIFDLLVDSGAELTDSVMEDLTRSLANLRRELLLIDAAEADLTLTGAERHKGVVQEVADHEIEQIEHTVDIYEQAEQSKTDVKEAQTRRRTGLVREAHELETVTLQDMTTSWGEFRDGFITGHRVLQAELDTFWQDFGLNFREVMLHDVQATFFDVFQAMRDENKSVTDALKGFWTQTVDYILSQLARLAAAKFLGFDVGTSGFSVPFREMFSMLSFQHGGQVPGSPQQAYPAMVHGKEWVIPDELMDMVRRAAAQPQVVQPIVEGGSVQGTGEEIDYDRLAKMVGQEVAQTVQRLPFRMNVNALDAASFIELAQRTPEAIIQPVVENLAYEGRLSEVLGRGR